MMYSDQDIQQALNSGELVVVPCSPEMVKPAGLTLHLGALLLKPDNKTVVDIRRNIRPHYDEITITDNSPYQIDPGEFLLGHTYEHVTVGTSLGFLIEGRSTLARLGLTVVQTAMLVYPGHRNRTITLELANHGPNPILLYPRMKIARAAIVELKSPSKVKYDDKGKYRGQELVGPPVFEEEILKG